MTSGWGLDLALLAGLIFFLFGLFILNRHSATPFDGLSDGLSEAETGKGGFSLFPRRLIRQAGIMPQQMLLLYWPGKLLLAIMSPLLLMEFLGPQAMGWTLMVSATCGFFTPDVWLLRRRAARRRRIKDSLSFLIDLIVAYLNAGQNLSQAFRQAARYGLTPRNPLAKEVLLLAREMDAGRDRKAAFSALAERTGVDDLHRLAAVMTVGFQVGSPIGQALSSQADMLRAKQVQRSTELINRMSMEALFPMMLVCLPMFLVLVIFPAAVQFYEMFQWIRVML
uniref:type II secretion system F family protein n=1 Tax=Marinobacterium profundum TaxID=1714300 RepID=UPI000832DA0E|nr:type II secretion system F family protein [Marinobacterium profundum]